MGTKTKNKRKISIETIIGDIKTIPREVIVGLIIAIIITVLGYIFGYLSLIIEFLYEIFSYSITFNIVIIFALIIAFFLIFRKMSGKKKFAVAALIIFAVVFIGMQTYNLHEISDKTVILIAEFDDKKATTTADVSKRIYDSLKTEKDKLNLESLIIEKSSKVIQSDEESWKEGTKIKAKTVIVIWGQYDDIDINTFFTTIKSSKKRLQDVFLNLKKRRAKT